MRLTPEYIENLQPKINNCLEDFAWCKKEIILSRELITQAVEDSNLWMRYRNGLDRLATVQLAVYKSEFPPQSDPEILEYDSPEKVLEYSSYLFRNTAVEAWVQASAIQLGLLRIRLDSRYWYGDKVAASSKLEEAIKIEADARSMR